MAKLLVCWYMYPIGAACDECGQRYVKRLMHRWPALSVDRCSCGGYAVYQKLSWERYNEWMEDQATYVEIGGKDG